MIDNPPSPQPGTAAGILSRRRHGNLLLLTLANLLPIGGVLLLDWDVAALVVLYWSENLVLGFYNIVKMLILRGPVALFPAAFFTFHYGAFCGAHGFFIVDLLLDSSAAPIEGEPWPLFFMFMQMLLQVVQQVLALAPPAWLWAVAGLMISHGYSLVTNFILAGERHHSSIPTLMNAPYKRIVVLHIAIIAGGMGVKALGEPLALLLALVLLKTIMDVYLHQREHRDSYGR